MAAIKYDTLTILFQMLTSQRKRGRNAQTRQVCVLGPKLLEMSICGGGLIYFIFLGIPAKTFVARLAMLSLYHYTQ